MLHSDNGYDVTNAFYRFEKFLANTLFLPNFTAVGKQIGELDWEIPLNQERVSPGSNQNGVIGSWGKKNNKSVVNSFKNFMLHQWTIPLRRSDTTLGTFYRDSLRVQRFQTFIILSRWVSS